MSCVVVLDYDEEGKPVLCRSEAAWLLEPYDLPVCSEHKKANKTIGFTFHHDGIGIGASKGSSFRKLEVKS